MQLKQGVYAPNLRKVEVEKKDNLMMFDKFRSDNEIWQNEELEKNKALLLEKAGRKTYVPDIPFLTEQEQRKKDLEDQRRE